MAVADRSAPARPSAVARHRDFDRWILAAIVLAGALLRFTTLGEQSLWYDEAATWQVVSAGFGHVIATVSRTESTPPLYYVLVWLWVRLFGLGAVGLRSFSALCSTLTIPVMFMLGRRLYSARVGLLAALLTAVNPFLFWYAQEARTYSLLLLLSALTLLALVCALEDPAPRRILAWGLSCALALMAHYYAAVVIVPEAAWFTVALHRRGRLGSRFVALGALPPAAAGAALLPLLVHQNDGRAAYLSAGGGSLARRLLQVLKQDIVGQGQPDKALLTSVGALLIACALVQLVRRGAAAQRSAAMLLLVIGAGGVALASAVAIAGADYIDSRNLLATWPALFLLIAAGLGSEPGRRIGLWATTGLVALSLACIANIVLNADYQRTDWRGAAQQLGPTAQPRAVLSDPEAQVPLRPYLSDLSVFPVSARIKEVDVIWIERASTWGALRPLTPRPLAGFSDQVINRAPYYTVVRYRSPVARLESATALRAVYPVPGVVLYQP